jgi:hypothetical protein
MSATNSFENSILLLICNNTGIANIGDATGLRGSTVAGSLYLSLHTSDPGEGGNQTSNETSYTSYARVAVARAAGVGGWNVSGSNPTKAFLGSTMSFPKCTGGSASITHFGVGTSSSGAGTLLFKGGVAPAIGVALNVTPQLTTSTFVSCD